MGRYGYVCWLFWHVKASQPQAVRTIRNLGLASDPPEDSCGFRLGPHCPGGANRVDILRGASSPYQVDRESQLAAADKFLMRHREENGLVTLDLGGDDFAPLLKDAERGTLSPRQIGVALNRLRRNYLVIVHRLRQRAPHARILLIGQYNPVSGVNLGIGGSLIAPLVAQTVAKINDITSSAAHGIKAMYVDVAQSFAGKASTLTGILSGNVHPKPLGYRVYAHAVWHAYESYNRYVIRHYPGRT
jgi:lysophospholipase L1-like esterase